MTSFAEVIAGKEPLGAVNQFCQRFAKGPVGPGDIVYTASKIATGGFQCTVSLQCLGGVEFAGEVCPNAKDAKTSAAQQVLEMYATEIQSMPFTAEGKANKKKKRPASHDAFGVPEMKVARLGEPAASVSGDIPSSSNKGELNTIYSKITRKVHSKGEIVYTTGQVVGGYQSQVQMPGLPPPWNNEIWAGEVHTKRTDAEQSVAGVALATLRSDPQLMAAFNAPPKPNQWILNGGLNNKGKGKGKGKGDNGGQQPTIATGMSAQDSAIWNQQYAAAMAAAGYGAGFSPVMTGLGGMLS